MNIVTKERLKNEIKALTYRRVISKKKGRRLQQEAGSLFNEVYADRDKGKLEGYYWGDERYKQAGLYAEAGLSVRNSGAREVRYMNIAYGLLKGTPYRSMEKAPRNAPNAEEVLKLIRSFCLWSDKRNWTIERVNKLLA